jgi:hypothetical protein
LRSILDMAAAASGDERIPCSTHPKPQSNILSQEYLFQSTKNSKGCKACVAINMFDLLHSRMDTTKRTSLQHEASKHESERDFYSANLTPIRRSFDHDISNSSHSLPTKHHKHPPSLQLALLLTSNSTRIPSKLSGKGRTGFNSTIYINLQVALEAILSFLSTFFFLPPSLSPSLPPSLPLWFLWHFLCQFCLHGVFVIVGNVKLRGFDCGLRHLRRLTYKNSKFVNVASREHNWAKCLTTSNNYSSKQIGSMTCHQVRQVRLHDL